MVTKIGRGGSISVSTIMGGKSGPVDNRPHVKDLPFFPLMIQRKSSVPELVRENVLVGKIEKHISDVLAGSGQLSADTGATLVEFKTRTSEALSESDPKALAQYSGYSAGFSYDKNARFVAAVDGAQRASEAIKTAGASAEKLEAAVKEAFSKPESELPPAPIIDVTA